MIDTNPVSSQQAWGRDFFNAIWRQRLPFLMFVLGVLVYVVVYNIITKPVYEAAAKVVFEQNRESAQALGLEAVSLSNVVGFDKTYLADHIEQTHTISLGLEVAHALPPEIADALVQEWTHGTLKSGFPTEDSLKKMEFLAPGIIGAISAAQLRESNVVVIKAQAATRRAAWALANTTAKVLTDRNVALKREQTSSTRKLIEDHLLPTAANELQNNDINLMNFKAQNKVVSLDDEAKGLLDRTTHVREDLARTQVDRLAVAWGRRWARWAAVGVPENRPSRANSGRSSCWLRWGC